MFAITWKQLWGHRRRLLATVLAVAIGVSFFVGTVVLSDTTTASFDDLVTTMVGRTDMVVRPAGTGAGNSGQGFVTVGQTRAQTRSMVRREPVIIALLGTTTGWPSACSSVGRSSSR